MCAAHAASVPAAEAEGEERFLGGLMMLPAYMLHDQVTEHSALGAGAVAAFRCECVTNVAM